VFCQLINVVAKAHVVRFTLLCVVGSLLCWQTELRFLFSSNASVLTANELTEVCFSIVVKCQYIVLILFLFGRWSRGTIQGNFLDFEIQTRFCDDQF